MNEQQLRYLVAAVETGTFTAAAESCFVAQPSLSAAIAKLEREAGTPLFHRIGRTIRPTAACEALVPVARDALRAMDTARLTLTRRDAELSGVLDITVQPTLVLDPATPLIAAFRSANPGIVVRLRSTSDQESMVDRIADGTSELGIGDVTPRQGLKWQRLGEEHYIAIMSLEWNDSMTSRTASAVGDGGGLTSARDLSGLPLIAPPQGSPTRAVMEGFFERAGVAMNVVVEVDHREALVPLVRAGAGIAIVPESMLDPQMTDGLVECRLTPSVRRRIGLVHRAAPLTPVAAAFKTFASQAARTER